MLKQYKCAEKYLLGLAIQGENYAPFSKWFLFKSSINYYCKKATPHGGYTEQIIVVLL